MQLKGDEEMTLYLMILGLEDVLGGLKQEVRFEKLLAKNNTIFVANTLSEARSDLATRTPHLVVSGSRAPETYDTTEKRKKWKTVTRSSLQMDTIDTRLLILPDKSTIEEALRLVNTALDRLS